MDIENKGESKIFEGKINENKDMMLEINIAEAPLFIFSKKESKILAKELLNNNEVSESAKKTLQKMYNENNNVKVNYRAWIDSKGVHRELIIASLKALPKAFAMDVFFGLMGLLVKDNSPMFPDQNGLFEFKSNEVSFSLNQLCKEMNISPGNLTYERIEDALEELFSVEYYSIDGGAIYEKSKERYISNKTAIKLINSYRLSERVKNEKTGKMEFYNGNVTFNELIIANLSLGFTKVIRSHQYLQLKAGIGRGLYLYLENNKTSNTIYTKRSFEVLKNKVPIEFSSPSRLKNKIKKPLENMIEVGFIKGYFYGDEILINGVKESAIYIIYKGTRKQIIDSLEKKNKVETKKKRNEKDLETDYKLEFPSDIKQELIDIGINSLKINEIMKRYSKWKLAEYILWIKDGIKQGKVKDAAGLFVFGITDEKVKVGKTHPQIIEFIAKIKSEVEGKEEISKAKIDDAYKIYIENELKLFEEEDEFAYIAIKSSTIDDIDKVYKKKIKSQRQLYNMATTEEEKDTMLKTIEKWEDYSSQREMSELFKELFIKEIKRYRGLKGYEDFKRDYIEKNK